MSHTVGEVARRAGISVRTLHHYDAIDLLAPSGRSDAGYRLYEHSDIARLQQILFYRELGVPLDEIAKAMTDPDFDRATALRRQREQLEAKATHLLAMIDAINAAIDATEKGNEMSSDDMLGVFGEFDPNEYEAEARERWGHSDAYRESIRRTSGYAKEDWRRMSAEADSIYRAFAALMVEGVAADSEEAMDVAERHRAHISAWFYECTPEIHVGLGEMYVADPRFTQNIDRHGEGVAAFMSEAILANGVRILAS
jgi:DNA-binding transcriptional MerR regulator